MDEARGVRGWNILRGERVTGGDEKWEGDGGRGGRKVSEGGRGTCTKCGRTQRCETAGEGRDAQE